MKNLTIKQKLIGMTLIFSLMLAGLSSFFIERFGAMSETYQKIPEERVPQLQVANEMADALLRARLNLNELFGVQRDLDNFKLYAKRVQDRFHAFDVLSKALVQGHRDLGAELPQLKGLNVPPARKGGRIEYLTGEAGKISLEFRQISKRIIELKGRQLDLVNQIGWYDTAENSHGVVKAIVETGRAMEELCPNETTTSLLAQVRHQEKNILMRADERYVERFKEDFLAFDRITSGELNRLGKKYHESFASIFESILMQKRLSQELKDLIRKELRQKEHALEEAVAAIKVRANEQMAHYADEAFSMKHATRILIIAISLAVMVLALTFGWFVSSGIARVLRRTIEGLDEGSGQVASASAQVSAASQSLAEGSSEQASSIEETSSSLEELASMTRQNAAHAGEANGLMEEAKRIVGEANGAMNSLTRSMEEISIASQETSKIIKTIDDIAFQTNLLALNAAVEAARAGEAGSGFAVVADEVRNLALRASEAAKSTSAKIEDTTTKVLQGSDLVTKTNEAFSRVTGSSEKVAELVGEISAASNEQAQGVEQINIAVAEMDKVVQQNAANAEESASASEEMNAQAEQMKSMVADLVALVDGKGNRAMVGPPNTRTIHRPYAPAERADRVSGPDVSLVPATVREIGPAHVLDQEEEDETF
ncbi:MAG: methyl-accepting chemotaxis protein [Desulfobacteraceae bacterium]|jgi:methyl-accepting chemotaxis protein